jgi:hypothetical protein
MRTFVATAGSLFGLIFIAHVLRLAMEGLGPLSDPVFILTSIASIGLFAWAAILLSSSRASRSQRDAFGKQKR